MTTNKATTIRITIPPNFEGDCTMVIERGDLATMVTFPQVTSDERYVLDIGDEIGRAYLRGLVKLGEVEKAPPPDVTFPEEPKPAPVTTTPKPAAKPTPSAPKVKWYTNPDTGEVRAAAETALNEEGWFGPFDGRDEAESHIPEWLKPAFGSKSKKR